MLPMQSEEPPQEGTSDQQNNRQDSLNKYL